MRANPAVVDVFDVIFAVTPWPALMLGHDGTLMATSEDSDVTARRLHETPLETLRGRASQYIAALRGNPSWLTPQETDTTRRLPSGAVVHERLILRRTDWGSCLIVVDQTELRNLQAADIQTARLASLGFMVAGVCHELSNPLTSLRSVVQMLRSEKQPGEKMLEKSLSNISCSVRKILDISRRLLLFSRVGDEPRSQFAVDRAIDDALQVMRQKGLLDHIDLHWSVDPTALVFGNIGQLSEVFLNLFLNAAHAMAGAGCLSIATVKAGRTVRVLVSDTGPRIPDAVLARMFEPFFTTKPTGEGTGLGLVISSEIVIEHGGTLTVHRTPPNVGSGAPGASETSGASFCVELPREKP